MRPSEWCNPGPQRREHLAPLVEAPSSCERRRALVRREHNARIVIAISEKGGEFPAQELVAFVQCQMERLEHDQECRRCIAEFGLESA